jgi:peptidoglycan hydrolase-like protein with peptidoglycan-binding domain
LVAQVQSRLAELGYYHGVIDGIMGPQTRAAIAAYEGTHHLVVDGMINQQLLDRMGLS